MGLCLAEVTYAKLQSAVFILLELEKSFFFFLTVGLKVQMLCL